MKPPGQCFPRRNVKSHCDHLVLQRAPGLGSMYQESREPAAVLAASVERGAAAQAQASARPARSRLRRLPLNFGDRAVEPRWPLPPPGSLMCTSQRGAWGPAKATHRGPAQPGARHPPPTSARGRRAGRTGRESAGGGRGAHDLLGALLANPPAGAVKSQPGFCRQRYELTRLSHFRGRGRGRRGTVSPSQNEASSRHAGRPACSLAFARIN